MQFGITIPLQKHLKIKALPYGEQLDLFYCWELHIIRRQGKQTLVAVNASNRFGIVLWGMKALQWKNIEKVMENGIRSGFLSEGYTEQQVNQYFEKAGEIILTKTHGRSPVATLNWMIECMGYLPVLMDEKQLFQTIQCHEINRNFCHAAGFTDYGLPVEFLETDMKRIGIL
jgi:hypothetical protein